MVGMIALVAVAGVAPICAADQQAGRAAPAESILIGAPAQEPLRQLWQGGAAFGDFLEGARARRALWLENWERAEVPADLLERARAVTGTWRILAVSIDSCSDSVSTIPFVAKLVEQVPSLEMRLIDPTAGRAITEAHRSPDGRAATPTLLLIGESWQEAGCWVERPAALQTWFLEKQKELPQRQLIEQKMDWYRDDAGRETVREIVELLEAAAAGTPACASAEANGI